MMITATTRPTPSLSPGGHMYQSSSTTVKCCKTLSKSKDAKSHWLNLFDFSPLCFFKCVLKSPAPEEALSHWQHLFDFSPLCVFKCYLKSPAQEEGKHISCICLTFLHCAFSNVASNRLHKKRHNHINYICFHFFLQCIFKCFLRSPALEDAQSHWLHLFDFSLL